MKSKWVKAWVVVSSAFVVGLCTLPSSSAQELVSDPYAAENEQIEIMKRAQAEAKRAAAEVKRAAAEGRRITHVYVERDTMSAIRKAAEELRDAEDDSARDDAEARLRQMLSQYFDEDMERRATELKDIEQRVRKLGDQLEKRGNHKPEIIDLQVKVLVNEAEGLGFFNNTDSAWSIFGPAKDRFRMTMPYMGSEMAAPAVPPTRPVAPVGERLRIEQRDAEPTTAPGSLVPRR